MDRLDERFTGEPDAVKAARPVRRGVVGKGLHKQYLAGHLPYFQPRLFQRHFGRPGDLRRALAVLEETVNTHHVHPRLGGRTPAQHRRGQRLRKLPPRYVIPKEALPIAAGRVTFIRRVSAPGSVRVLSQSYRVGKRHHGRYVKLVLDTQRGWLTAYLNGQKLKRWPYKMLNE